MFERMTEQARDAVVAAQEIARSHGHPAIGTVHLLAGVLDAETLAARLLNDEGVTRDAVVAELAAVLAGPGVADDAPMPFDAELTGVFERAPRRAIRVGHNYVTAEHLLEALLADETGARAAVERAGADPQILLERVTAAAR